MSDIIHYIGKNSDAAQTSKTTAESLKKAKVINVSPYAADELVSVMEPFEKSAD